MKLFSQRKIVLLFYSSNMAAAHILYSDYKPLHLQGAPPEISHKDV